MNETKEAVLLALIIFGAFLVISLVAYLVVSQSYYFSGLAFISLVLGTFIVSQREKNSKS